MISGNARNSGPLSLVPGDRAKFARWVPSVAGPANGSAICELHLSTPQRRRNIGECSVIRCFSAKIHPRILPRRLFWEGNWLRIARDGLAPYDGVWIGGMTEVPR
jgi:hypothetical protein